MIVAQAFSIIWRVLVKLAEAAVILAMFHIAKSTFETVVISALVLIYVSVISSFSILGRALVERGHADLWRFIEIAKLLKYSNIEVLEDAQKEQQEELQKSQAGFWTNAIFNSLFALIAIWNLVHAVV